MSRPGIKISGSFYKQLMLVIAVAFSIASCSVKKYIPEDEHLYQGAILEITYPDGQRKDKPLESSLKKTLYPKPNGKFLGMHIGLWSHYKTEAEKAGFVARYIYKKYGEEPVYLSSVDLNQVEDLMSNRSINRGYFYPSVDSRLITKKQKGSAFYTIEVGTPYRLMSYKVLSDSVSVIDSMLVLSLKESAIDTGSKFDLDLLKKERKRIDEYLKNNGFYFFNADYLVFRSDTNQYEHRGFDLYLSIKSEIDRSKLKPYRLGKVKVLMTSDDRNDSSTVDTSFVKNVEYIEYQEWVKPKYIDKQLVTNPDSIYRLRYAQNTTRRLSSISAFRHANIRFSEPDTSGEPDILDATLYLAPAKKYNIRTGTHAYTKSTGFAGPGLVLTLQNRNLFKGAEILEVQGIAGYEFQISRGTSSGLNNFEFRLENSLTFPRLLAPLIKFNPYKAYSIPNSRIHLNFNYQQRALYYSVNYFYTSFGYDWYSNARVRWGFIPLSLNYMRVYNRTPEFEEILDDNPFLARSFDDQFIPAISGSFRYNEYNIIGKKRRMLLNIGLEQAGLITGALSNNDTLLGQPFAQYVKSDIDLRYDVQIAKDKNLVSRIFVGMGYPLGSSQSLPYVKQYFSGGPNSIRAFPVRSLGPGSFVPEQIDDNSFFDQAGDIRFEFNTEYRFPIIDYLKGALFVDVGNIWLFNENPSLPGAQFTREWYKQLAVGAGVGLRFDVEVVVVRLDLAHPVRYPSGEYEDFWNINNTLSKIVWNFAIGYPF